MMFPINGINTIRAVYQNGVFHPHSPVNVAEGTEVWFDLRTPHPLPQPTPEQLDAIYEVLGRRHVDPESPGNLAERHNEHQP